MIFPTANKNLKLDMKLEYSLDLKFENILNANPTSPTIIILPPNEYTLSRRTRSEGTEDEDEDVSSEVSILSYCLKVDGLNSSRMNVLKKNINLNLLQTMMTQIPFYEEHSHSKFTLFNQ